MIHGVQYMAINREELYQVNSVIRFIRRKVDVLYYRQIFHTQNILGDRTELIYDENGIELYRCPGYGYLEIFGLNEEQFKMVEEQLEILVADAEQEIKLERLEKVFSRRAVAMILEYKVDIDSILDDIKFQELESRIIDDECGGYKGE